MDGSSGREVSALDEFPLLHQPSLVENRYETLDDHTSSSSKSSVYSTKAAVADALNQFVGILERPSADYHLRAVEQWTNELRDLLAKGESEFVKLLHQRTLVQSDVHLKALGSQHLRKKNKGRAASKLESTESNVPAIVRLGVLTMFPLIEALSTIPGANYDKLCGQTLDIVIKTIATLPTLALSREPSDVLDAFKDFITRQIDTNQYSAETQAKAQSLVALISLVVSQGRAQNVFQLLDVLFKVHSVSGAAATLPVGATLRHLIEYNRELDIPAPLETVEEAWTLDIMKTSLASSIGRSASAANQSDGFAFVADSVAQGSLATDGKFLYIHSPQGLSKVGTGLHHTIKGHYYATNPSWRPADRWSSLVCINDKLYYWSPDSSYETYRPAKDPVNPSQSVPQANASAPPASAGSAPAAPAPPRVCHVITIFSTETLTQIGRVRVEDSSLSLQSRMITDGKYLLFVGKQRGKGSKSGSVSQLQQQQQLQQLQLQQQLQQNQLGGNFNFPSFGGSGPSVLGSMPVYNPSTSIFGSDNHRPNEFGSFSFGNPIPQNVLDLHLRAASPSQPLSWSNGTSAPSAYFNLNGVAADANYSVMDAGNLQPSDFVAQPPVEEGSSSGSSDEDEEDSEEVVEEDEANDDEESTGGEENEEDLYEQEQQSPRRRAAPARANRAQPARPKIKEEDDAVTSTVCVEWYDVSVPFQSGAARLSESASTVPELATIPTIAPVRLLELASRTSPAPALAGAALAAIASTNPGEEVLPASFGNISFFTNGHHLVAVSKQSGLPFRVFGMLDGKLAAEPQTALGTPSRWPDARDSFSYDSLSNTIWSYRYDSSSPKVSRFHNMGLVPHYSDVTEEESDSIAMQVDAPASSSAPSLSKSPAFTFPTLPPLSPEVLLNKLDVWTSAPKKTRLSGVSKPSHTTTFSERVPKDNLTALECISIVTASLDRLARHHWAYNSHAIVDDSHVSHVHSYHFTVGASIDALQSLFANLEHTIALIKSGSNLETAGPILLSFLRILKLNLHFFNTSGKAITIKDDQRKLFTGLRTLLVTLSNTAGLPTGGFMLKTGDARLDAQIRREACDTLCIGFFNFLHTPGTQLDFLKSVAEGTMTTSSSPSPLSHKLNTALSSYYRVGELLLDDPKIMMDVDQEPSLSKSFKKPIATSSGNLTGSAANLSSKDKPWASQREQPFHAHASPLLVQLIKKSLHETTQQLDKVFATQSIAELRSSRLDEYSSASTLRLLFALQMEVVSHTYVKGFVCEYFGVLARAVGDYFAVLKNYNLDEPISASPSPASGNKMDVSDSAIDDTQISLRKAQWKASHVVLESSVLGSLLPSLIRSLTRRFHVRDPAFVINIFDKLCTLLVSVDKFNQTLSMVTRADQNQLLRSAAKKASASFNTSSLDSDPQLSASSDPHCNWLLDLQSALAVLARKCVVTLLEGESVSEKERQCQDWLDTRLINGGIDETPQNVEKMKWLESFAEGREAAALYTWIKEAGGSRPHARPSAKHSLERAERYALAAMMKHAGLVDDALAFSKALVDRSPLSSSHVGRFSFIAKKSTALASLLTRRAEMQKAWQLAVQDKVNDFDVFRDMVQRPERLLDFCEMRGVEANLVNTEETVKRLMQKLQEEIAMNESLKKTGNVVQPDIYEAICGPIVERAMFLIKLLPSNRTIKHPAAEGHNPYSSGKPDTRNLRASAPGSSEAGARGFLTKSMSHLPTTESQQAKIRQRETEVQDNQNFSQRVGELRSWLQAYSDWEQAVLLHNRSKRDEPPPTSPIQGVIAFTTNQSITVKDWERVLRVQATRAKSREQGLIYLNRLLSTCHFATPRHQLLGPLSVTHYLDGIQSSGQALITKVSDLFGELFIALAALLKDRSLDSTSRLLALNVCAITYTENDALLLSKADIFQLLHQVMSESASDMNSFGLSEDALSLLRQQHKALHDAAWTCFRLFATQVVSWHHHDGLHFERAVISRLQQQAFDVYLLQLKRFSESLVKHDLSDWEREILRLEPNEGHDFAFELVFLLRLLSEVSKAWTDANCIPTLLQFLSSRTAPRAQRVVLRLLRKLLPTSAATGDKTLVLFCLDELGKWIFQGKCTSSDSPSKRTQETKPDDAKPATEPQRKEGAADADAKASSISLLSSSDSLEQILTSGVLDSSTLDIFKAAYSADSQASRNRASFILPSNPDGRPGSLHGASSQSKPLSHDDAVKLAGLRAKFGDVVQIHDANTAVDFSAGARGKNAALIGLNPVYWADGGAASMLASEYIALLRYLASPTNAPWLLVVRESLAAAIAKLPAALALISSDPESLSADDAKTLFRALSALCLLGGFPEPIRVGCKVVVDAPVVVSHAERVTGTVVAHNSPATHADVVLDSEASESQTTHSLDVKQLQAIPEIEIDVSNLTAIAPSLIPVLLDVIVSTSSLDHIPEPKPEMRSVTPAVNANLASSSMDVDPQASQESLQSSQSEAVTKESPPAPHHVQNVWLYQELKSKALRALNVLLDHPECANFVASKCADKLPILLQLAQKADPTTYMEKVERQLTAIAARLWDVQTIPSDLEGRSRRRTQPDSRGMSEALPHFWNASKANALPTGLDKTCLAPGTIVLDDDARCVQLHGLRSGGSHSGNFGRPSRGGLGRFGGSSHKEQAGDVIFMFGNCLIPSKGVGQYYFEVQIHGEGTVERPPGVPSKPHISIGLVPDPQSSGPATASTTGSGSSYRQSGYRGGSSDGSGTTPFPPGSYCYVSTRNKAWVSEGNVRQEGYGEHFGYGTVVGCLWDQTERTISFTKDGEELDVAFRGVLAAGGDGKSGQDRLVPCISSSRGVQLTINFGQTAFRYTPILDDALDAEARETKRKEAEEKRQKAIQEEAAKRKAEQEQREAIFNEDASLLLSMGFCARHALRAMMHAGWTYKNRWLSQEGVLMAANWLTEATPEQLGPAGDLPSESAPPVVEEAKPASTSAKKKLSKSDKGSAKQEQAAPSSSDDGTFKKPVNPESDYSVTKSSDYVLGDAYSLSAPRRTGTTLASIWKRDILPLVTADIPFPANDPTPNQLVAYAEAGNEDALKSNLTDLYNGKIPAHIRLPSQLKIVEIETTQLKMTQISPDMSVQCASAESGSPLARFVGKSGVVLDRDLKRSLVLIQFVSSEDGSLEEWWFHVSQLAKDRAPSRPYSHIQDAPSLHTLLATKTQQYSYFAARRALLSLLRHAPLAFDVARAKRDLEELALAAQSGNRMDITQPAPAASAESSSAPSAQTVPGAIDVQDAVQLMSREYLATPEVLISPLPLFESSQQSVENGVSLGAKLVELLARVFEQQGSEACAHLLNALMQKCIALLDLSSHFSNSKSLTFSHHDSIGSSGTPAPTAKGKSSATTSKEPAKEAAPAAAAPAPPSDGFGVVSMPNYLHKVHIPGARACLVIFHADTDRNTRLNVYLDEDLSDVIPSMGGLNELENSGKPSYAPGGPFQPVLVPTNTFWVKARASSQASNALSFGGGDGRVALEYKVTVVPVSSDVALGRWLAEFLALSTTSSAHLHVPLDFNPLLNTLIDYLYLTPVPTPLKESIMALLTRVLHELRRRARGQVHKLCQLVDPIGRPLDLSRLNLLKKEMISLYDNERRSASNSDSSKKRGSMFTTYLQSLVELMISVRLYELDKNARQKLLADSVPHSFVNGAPDETMKVALALAQSLASPEGSSNPKDDELLGAAFALFAEADLPEGPMKIPAEGEEDSSTTSEEASDLDDGKDEDKPSRLAELFASTGVPASAQEAAAPTSANSAAPSVSEAGPASPAKDADSAAKRVPTPPKSPAPEHSEDMDRSASFEESWGDYSGGMPDDMDDELAQAIALSMREQGLDDIPIASDSESIDDNKMDVSEKPEEAKKPEEKAPEAAEKKDEAKPESQPASEEKPKESKPEGDKKPAESEKPASSAMEVDAASAAAVPPPPPPPPSASAAASTPSPSVRNLAASLFGSFSPKTPETPAKKTASTVTPSVADPSWFATLVAAAQALENFSGQVESSNIPALSFETVSSAAIAAESKSEKKVEAASSSNDSSAMQVDEEPAPSAIDQLSLQFVKDSIRVSWNNTRSADFVRQRMYLLDHVPATDADKRTELMTALEELVEEKALVVDGSLYLPVDYRTKRTKTWMIVEVQSTENVPSTLTFKDPNFTTNKPVRLDVIPIRRILDNSKNKSAAAPATSATSGKSTPVLASSSTDKDASSSQPAAQAPSTAALAADPATDIHYDEPDPALELPYANVDERWREYVRSRFWDKKSQQLTREFRDALTEIFVRFSTNHTTSGVIGKTQLNALQTATGSDQIEDFEFFFNFGTKAHTYTPGPKPHSGKNVFFEQEEAKEAARNIKSNSMQVDEPSASAASASVTETGLTLDAFLTMYTNQALQLPLTTLEELTNLGFDLHLNRSTFSSHAEAEAAVLNNTFLTPKADLELVRYVEQLLSEVDVTSPLQLTVSQLKSIPVESHLAQIYPRLVRLSMPLLCLRYEMIRQLNQKVNEVFALINMNSRGALATWLSSCRGLIFHSLKMNFVYSVVERTADDSSACPSVMLNRIELSANKDHVMATRTEDAFTKNTAFGQAFTQLLSTDPAAFRRPKPIGAEPHFAMRVLFQKENVQGDGGPYRQFFTDVSKELAEVLPLLVPCPNAQTKIGNNRDKFVVTPSCNSRTYLKMYKFLGWMMGMAMRTGVMLAIDLPSFFWKPLVGLAPSSQDIRDIDHSFHTVLKYLKSCPPDVFVGETRTIFDHFQTTLSDKSKMLLKAGGDQLEVTYDNRLEYCRLAEAARCNESYTQLLEIRRGLSDFIPLSLLNMFTWQDLQWRVCGRPQIDLKLLKRHTGYAEGITPASPHIRFFWQVLRSFSQEDRRAFVRFAWAQERLPADDQEFARSQTRMMIKQGPVSDQVFPTADTCFFNLSLPVYSSPDILRERLLFAIHADGAMDNDRPNHDNEDR